MTDLFCTPEQGARLKELLPELESGFVWRRLPNWSDWLLVKNDISDNKFHEIIPALTLQELRDVALKMGQDSKSLDKFNELLWINTAPELADWVISRLEAQP
jgi:hypothetical protein